jgi:hypothetical protein
MSISANTANAVENEFLAASALKTADGFFNDTGRL